MSEADRSSFNEFADVRVVGFDIKDAFVTCLQKTSGSTDFTFFLAEKSARCYCAWRRIMPVDLHPDDIIKKSRFLSLYMCILSLAYYLVFARLMASERRVVM